MKLGKTSGLYKCCRDKKMAPFGISLMRWPAAATVKSLQSCLTLCDPIDRSPRGSPVPGILQARTLEWVANIKVIQIQCLIVIVLNAVSPVGSVAGKMLSEHKWEEFKVSQAPDSSLNCNLVPILIMLYPFHAQPFHSHPRVSSSSPSKLISQAYHYTYCSCHPDCFSASFQTCVTETF